MINSKIVVGSRKLTICYTLYICTHSKCVKEHSYVSVIVQSTGGGGGVVLVTILL